MNRFLNKISLTKRLLLFPISLIVATALLLGVVLFISNNYSSLLDHIRHDDMEVLSEITKISSDFDHTNTNILRIFDADNTAPELTYTEAAYYLDSLHKLLVRVSDLAVVEGHLQLEVHHAEENINTDKLYTALDDYLQTVTSALDKYYFDPERANKFIQESLSKSTVVNHYLAELTQTSVLQMKEEIQEEAQHTSFSALWLFLSAAVVVLITISVNTGIANGVASSLLSIRKGLRKLAHGDLNVDLEGSDTTPEVSEMAEALNAYKSTQLELRQTLDELSKVKSNLENRVNERTSQLRDSNYQLLEEIQQHQLSQDQLKIYAQAIHATSEAIIISDAKNIILEVNDSYCQITGYDREEVIGKPPGNFKSGKHDDQFYQNMWRAIQDTGHWKGEIWDRRKNGEIFPKWLTINSVINEHGTVTNYVGVFTDISDLKSKEAQLERLAHFDPLTQLPNRMLCKERVEQKLLAAKRNNSKVAILFVDLDRFKLINDSLGHAAGDELLKTVAERLESTLRAEDLMFPLTWQFSHTIARLGGDEFIISLGDLKSIDYVADIVERIQETINSPISLCGREVTVDSSIGVAIYPDDGIDYDTLSRHADTAMYRAKEAGRGQFVLFTEQMNQQAHQRLELEIEMKTSLQAKHFELYYQPKVDPQTNEIHSFEALVRWNHPDLGLIPPNEFIEVAEETGMIIPLGAWILEEACQFCYSLNQRYGQEFQVAVNISTRQFQDPNLMKKISHALEASKLPTQCLELEITESAIFGDIEDAIDIINVIRSTGISFALDDFGTGYSSLNYLKQLPVDTLKIDRSFIAQLDDAETDDDRNIVETVILLGHQFNMKTVAEGVENTKQAQFLTELGCDLLQGFLYSKPVEGKEFTDLLERHINTPQISA